MSVVRCQQRPDHSKYLYDIVRNLDFILSAVGGSQKFLSGVIDRIVR